MTNQALVLAQVVFTILETTAAIERTAIQMTFEARFRRSSAAKWSSGTV